VRCEVRLYVPAKEEIVMSTTPDMANSNRTTRIASGTKLLAGFNEHVPAAQSMTIGSTTYTHTQIEQALQGMVDGESAVVTARAAWQNAVKANRDKRVQEHPFLSALRQALTSMFGNDVVIMADFGLSPRKAPIVSPATKVVAAQKNRATRAARHTMGKVQKAGIKGDGANVATPTPAASSHSELK
jgi:hypothetical protein